VTPPRLAALASAALVGAVLGACGTEHRPLSATCTQRPETIERALAAAPGQVALTDGTRLSECVNRARSNADLQSVGIVITRAADDLAARAARDPNAAIALGYLIGATRLGAAKTNGIHAELVRRVEQAARTVSDTRAAALAQGVRAGEARG
jgi:hypothetical protein